LSAGAHWGSLQRSPRPSSWFRGWGPGEREGWRRGEKEGGKGGEGVPECPNPELASLTAAKIIK